MQDRAVEGFLNSIVRQYFVTQWTEVHGPVAIDPISGKLRNAGANEPSIGVAIDPIPPHTVVALTDGGRVYALPTQEQAHRGTE